MGYAAERKCDKIPRAEQCRQAVSVVKLYQIKNNMLGFCSAVIKGADGYAAEQKYDKNTQSGAMQTGSVDC